ncbi:MAG: hypothetical protein BM559_02775 [Roseobacter sp. MedPE-SWchi]|nr:MAG: hypothetical protein BM559_02775 [Roseobacter sp. MedPE-SWchi]
MSLDELASQIAEEWKSALSEGWGQLSSFHKSQTKKLAHQAALLAQLRISGELQHDSDMFEFLVDQLKDKTENFAIAIANLTALTFQEAWNASVGVLWGAINSALGSAGLPPLPVPSAN